MPRMRRYALCAKKWVYIKCVEGESREDLGRRQAEPNARGLMQGEIPEHSVKAICPSGHSSCAVVSKTVKRTEAR